MWTERNTNGSCPRLPPRPGPWPEIPKAEGRRNILTTFCQRTVLVPCKPPKRATNPGKGPGGVDPARRDLGRPSDPKPGPRNLKISTRPCLTRNPPSRCRTFDHHRPSPDDPIPLLFRGPQGQDRPPRDRLLRECFVAIEQILALDSSRFSDGPLAVATPAELREIEKSLKAILGFNQAE